MKYVYTPRYTHCSKFECLVFKGTYITLSKKCLYCAQDKILLKFYNTEPNPIDKKNIHVDKNIFYKKIKT